MGGLWWACDEPERPTDGLVRWHYSDCTGCRFKAKAKLLELPDDTHVQWLKTNNNEGGQDNG